MFTADSEKPTIPEGEIKALIRQGADSGVFEALERDMMPRCCASVTVLTREDEFLEDKSLEDESLRVNCGLYLDAFTKRIDHAIVEIDQESHNHTLAGFDMYVLERIPRESDHFEWQGCRLEVVDRDGKRGDKLLVTPWEPHQPDL